MPNIDQLATDMSDFATLKSGWGKGISLQETVDSESFDTKCLFTRHWLTYSDDGGVKSDTIKASVSVPISELERLSYPHRNSSGLINVKSHYATIDNIKYIVKDQFPDEGMGLVVMILGLYSENDPYDYHGSD